MTNQMKTPRGGYKLVVFDMDGTLTVPRSCWVVLHEAFGSNNDEGLGRYLAGEITDEEFVALDIQLWQEAKGREIMASEIIGILDGIPWMAGAKELLAWILRSPLDLVFITGGLDWLAQRLVREAAELAGLSDAEKEELPLLTDPSIDYQAVETGSPAVEIHANHLNVDPDGKLTGQGHVGVVAKDKGSLLNSIIQRRGLRPDQVVAVGDGPVDLPMFKMAGLGVAVPDARSEVLAEADLHLQEDLRELIAVLDL